MIEKIIHQNLLFALIIRNKVFDKGISFLTDDSLTQQLAIMKYDKGFCIQPHFHLPIERVIHGTPETIIINKGTCNGIDAIYKFNPTNLLGNKNISIDLIDRLESGIKIIGYQYAPKSHEIKDFLAGRA